MTGYDCGVACLLYGEKAGQGASAEDIDRGTTQRHITAYRGLVQRFIEAVQG